jgi:hypothetical protein
VTSEGLTIPRVIHELPGRVRISLAGWPDAQLDEAEARLGRLPGVRRARASHWSNNVLVEFDPSQLDTAGIVSRLARLAGRTASPTVANHPRLSVRELLVGAAGIAALLASGGPLGMLITGVGAVSAVREPRTRTPALASAVAAGLVTRSPGRALWALEAVGSHPGPAAGDGAHRQVAARALRAGIEALIAFAPRAVGPGALLRAAVRAGAHVMAFEVALALTAAVLARAGRRS